MYVRAYICEPMKFGTMSLYGWAAPGTCALRVRSIWSLYFSLSLSPVLCLSVSVSLSVQTELTIKCWVLHYSCIHKYIIWYRKSERGLFTHHITIVPPLPLLVPAVHFLWYLSITAYSVTVNRVSVRPLKWNLSKLFVLDLPPLLCRRRYCCWAVFAL